MSDRMKGEKQKDSEDNEEPGCEEEESLRRGDFI